VKKFKKEIKELVEKERKFINREKKL